MSLSDEHRTALELNALGRLEQGANFGMWQGQSCVGTALVLLRLLTLARGQLTAYPLQTSEDEKGGSEKQLPTLVKRLEVKSHEVSITSAAGCTGKHAHNAMLD